MYSYNTLHCTYEKLFFSSVRQDNCLMIIVEPVEKFFVSDGVRPERYMHFDYTVTIHEAIKETMNKLQIPFVELKVEYLQERVNFVMDQIFKKWSDLKRGHLIDIPDDDKPK